MVMTSNNMASCLALSFYSGDQCSPQVSQGMSVQHAFFTKILILFVGKTCIHRL